MDRLLATKSEVVGLIVRAISFQDFQPMWSQTTNVTDGQTDRRTTCDPNTAHLHQSALRGKNGPSTLCLCLITLVNVDNFNNSFTVIFLDKLQKKIVLDRISSWNVDALPSAVRDNADFVRRQPFPHTRLLFRRKFGDVTFGIDPWYWSLQRENPL